MRIMKKSNGLFLCNKRKVEVETSSYCDWFEKKRSNLTKRCCKNCKYFPVMKKKNEKTSKTKKKKDQAQKEEE